MNGVFDVANYVHNGTFELVKFLLYIVRTDRYTNIQEIPLITEFNVLIIILIMCC